MSIKLLIADDEDMIRTGLAKYLKLHTDRFDRIYEAENGQEALKFGAKDYFLKPMRAADILECLNRLADEYIGADKAGSDRGRAGSDRGRENVNPFVKEAVDYIREYYMQEISLSEIAQKLGISASYLSTLLNQGLGCGFTDYLNQVRIERACCYLEQNYLKNYEIAYKVGFRDEKYFSKVFKKIKGISPKDYRKKGM